MEGVWDVLKVVGVGGKWCVLVVLCVCYGLVFYSFFRVFGDMCH